MASFNFQAHSRPTISDAASTRVRYDALGSNLPRKRQMFAEELMSPTVIPYSPNNLSGGHGSRKFRLMPGDST
jgi:hypothetical protein